MSETTGLTISIPLDKVAVGNLTNLLDAKGTLIKKALGIAELPIIIEEDVISFPWFEEMPAAEECTAYTAFIAALCQMSIKQKRINSAEKPTDNEKYAFRCFLLRLGFIGDAHKATRKILLKNLTGSSAFRNGSPAKEVHEDAIPNAAIVERLRNQYSVGTRVELLEMDDVQAPPIGTQGTVLGVDDTGSLMVSWDNGSGLNVVYGIDRVKKL